MCRFKWEVIEDFALSKSFLLFLYMYTMSSEEKDLTQIGNITAETYSENKIHRLCVYKKFTPGFYVILVGMIDSWKLLCHQNLCYSATTKNKKLLQYKTSC